MGQDLNKIKNLYNTVAKEYTQTFSGDHEKKPKDQEILQRFYCEIGNRRPVWDFGCGPGQTTKYLNNLGIEISGLDLSERMLEQAKALYPEIHFQKGNILKLEFKNETIAGIISFYSIVHFTKEQLEVACHEIFRVLQPGGILLLTFHIGEESLNVEEFLGKEIEIEFMFFTTDFISCCLKKIGFEKIDIITREPYFGVEYESQRAYVFAIKP